MEIKIAKSTREIEECFTDGIFEAIVNNSQIECDEEDAIVFPGVDSVNTFEDWGVVTNNKGVVVLLEDNTEIYITVQAIRRHW